MLAFPAFAAVVAAAQAAPALEAAADPAATRINPTQRTLRFVVPVTDGPRYLGDVILAVAPDDAISVQADRAAANARTDPQA